MEEKYKERIVIDPGIMVGKPVIKGTRIPVDAIIRRLAEGMGIIKGYLKTIPTSPEKIYRQLWNNYSPHLRHQSDLRLLQQHIFRFFLWNGYIREPVHNF